MPLNVWSKNMQWCSNMVSMCLKVPGSIPITLIHNIFLAKKPSTVSIQKAEHLNKAIKLKQLNFTGFFCVFFAVSNQSLSLLLMMI